MERIHQLTLEAVDVETGVEREHGPVYTFAGGRWERLDSGPLNEIAASPESLEAAGYRTYGDLDAAVVLVWEFEDHPAGDWPFVVEFCPVCRVWRIFVGTLPDLVAILQLLLPLANVVESWTKLPVA